jgi:hypothetical protein
MEHDSSPVLIAPEVIAWFRSAFDISHRLAQRLHGRPALGSVEEVIAEGGLAVFLVESWIRLNRLPIARRWWWLSWRTSRVGLVVVAAVLVVSVRTALNPNP